MLFNVSWVQKLPPEARDYISILESQTHRLEEELEECDELLMYLPYHSKGDYFQFYLQLTANYLYFVLSVHR